MVRLAALLLLAAPGAFAAAPSAPAPGAPARDEAARKAKVLPGIVIDLTSRDGWQLKAKHVPARDENPTVLLLHARGRKMEDWYPLGRAFANGGYGYLALDLRGHGLSTTSPEGQKVRFGDFKITKAYNEYANMSQDVEAAMAYLASQGVAEENIGIVGAEVGSSIGLKYAAVHPKVPFIVLLTPGMHLQEVLTVNAMRNFRGRPMLLVYGEQDKKTAAETFLLANIAKATAGEANTTILPVPRLGVRERGAKLLTGALIRKIVDWIADPVKPAEPAAPVSSGPAPGGEAPKPEPYPDAADDLTRPDPTEAEPAPR